MMIFFRIPFRVFKCLVRPPWGILFALTGVFVTMIMMFGENYFAQYQNEKIFRRLENADSSQKAEITKQMSQQLSRQLARHNESGIKLLVLGLSSKEEATALACHGTLKNQLSDWKSLPNQEVSLLYLSYSKLLAESLKTYSPNGLQLARDLSQQILNDILDRGIEKQHVVSENCHKVIDAWQSGQSRSIYVANIDRPPVFSTTLPSAGEPRNARVSGINVPYLSAQKENTTPEGRLRQLTEFPETENHHPLPTDSKPAAVPRVGFYAISAQSSAPADRNQVLIARKESPKVLDRQQETSPFLDDRLRQIAVRDLSKLPTQDLMRLLNHDQQEISRQSENLLKNRDGFQDEHIRLATKLYHPDVNIRKSILPQLVQDDQLEVSNWVSELLKDPDREVRYATAVAIRRQIPLDETALEIAKNMMQTDSDQRVAALGRELETRISTGIGPTQQRR